MICGDRRFSYATDVLSISKSLNRGKKEENVEQGTYTCFLGMKKGENNCFLFSSYCINRQNRKAC